MPTISLIIFLIVASYHFGKEDTQFLVIENSYLNQLLFFIKGTLIVLAPIYFHFDETINIFKFLLVDNENFYKFLNFIETNKILLFGIILSTLANIILFTKNFEIKKFVIFLDYFSIMILNYYFSPLLAFTLYFCFLHSIRHSITLIVELEKNDLNLGLKMFVKKALPLTILTASLCLVGLYFMNNIYSFDSSILKIIFIGLASLTFPHILLEYFLERNEKKEIKILLSAPRGFCAGVERAIEIVEKSIQKYGAPVYVRHEIVHNKYVVDDLKNKGAIFVEELEEIKDKSRPVIFSAHGVPKKIPEDAKNYNMTYVDATCPLVSKVHREAENLHKAGYHLILIGHQNHPEVIGTMGQLPNGSIDLIQNEDDAKKYTTKNPNKISYVTQTTLSVDDTKDIIKILKEKFPKIKEPMKEDICYATTNRQMAVKNIAKQCDLFFVIGSRNSSNSVRLVEVAKNQVVLILF